MNKADVVRVAVRMSKQSVGGQVSSSLSCEATPGVCGQHWALPIIRGSGKWNLCRSNASRNKGWRDSKHVFKKQLAEETVQGTWYLSTDAGKGCYFYYYS